MSEIDEIRLLNARQADQIKRMEGDYARGLNAALRSVISDDAVEAAARYIVDEQIPVLSISDPQIRGILSAACGTVRGVRQ